jgi:hypothetical protein
MDSVDNMGSPDHSKMTDPGPEAAVVASRERIRRHGMAEVPRTDRIQSPHSRDEADQQNSVELRGAGR